jgi:hypothetical protein
METSEPRHEQGVSMSAVSKQSKLHWIAAAIALSWAAPLLATPIEGSSSTFFGVNAGFSGSGGAGLNTFVGSSAGYDTSSGVENTFVGGNSGQANNGANNSFFGAYAGFTNTSGTLNTFIGDQSGYLNSTGAFNTFVGQGAGYANTTAQHNTFIGYYTGHSNATGQKNVFVGDSSGASNTTGNENAYFGVEAGFSNTTGQWNTALGRQAGYLNNGGIHNVFVGFGAGYSEGGSNKLYIDSCVGGGGCVTPLIYGEFDNNRIRLNGMTEVHFNGLAKSQLNFSQNSTDTGGFLTSVLDNNFFMSSGARYDGALVAPNNWVQRSSDGKSVIQGSGGLGYRVFTSQGNSVGAGFAPTVRLLIDYNGLFALNANSTVAGHELHTSSGAYLTTAGVWTNASSREYKDAIAPLSMDAAEKTLAALEPVTFRYKNEADQQRVGFIAEDVPELVAMKDRKGLSPMDIVAVLTRVLQEKSRVIDDQAEMLRQQQKKLEDLSARVAAMQAQGR